MGEIRIGVPHVTYMDNGKVRLTAVITLPDGNNRELWFSTDASNADYIVHERADAFLVGLIPFIARNGGKVVCDAPVSRHLLHNLRHLLSPVLPAFHSDFVPLDIISEADDTDFRHNGVFRVATGCSCGVDSLATLATYTGTGVSASMRVDTLTFFDVGSHGNRQDSSASDCMQHKKLAEGRMLHISSCAKALGMPLVKIESNVSDYNAGFSHIEIHTFRSMSAVLFMQKLFAVYHYASTYPITQFRISFEDIAYADEFLLRCLSTESTCLYSALSSLTRQERTAIVADYGPAKEFLNVCVKDVRNCGFCFKCARTMFQLDLIEKLDEFRNVFDIDVYRKNRRRILKLIAKDTHFHDEYLAAAANSSNCPYSRLRLKIAFASGMISQSIVRVRKRLTGKKSAL